VGADVHVVQVALVGGGDLHAGDVRVPGAGRQEDRAVAGLADGARAVAARVVAAPVPATAVPAGGGGGDDGKGGGGGEEEATVKHAHQRRTLGRHGEARLRVWKERLRVWKEALS